MFGPARSLVPLLRATADNPIAGLPPAALAAYRNDRGVSAALGSTTAAQNDLTGNGLHLTQSDPAMRPVVRADGLEFAGGRRLALSAAVPLSGAYTIGCSGYFAGPLMVPWGGLSDGSALVLFSDGNIYWCHNADLSFVSSPPTAAAFTATVVRTVGGLGSFRINGAAITSGGVAGGVTFGGVGLRPTAGQTDTNAANRYRRLAVYDRELTAPELAALEGWLAAA